MSPASPKPWSFIVASAEGNSKKKAHLGVAVLVAHHDHGHSLRQQQSSGQVAYLSGSELLDAQGFCGSLDPTVPRQVVALPVSAGSQLCLAALRQAKSARL